MRIPLTQGKFAIVGPLDYKFLMRWKWYYALGYAKRNSLTVNGKRHTIWMHRVILERMGCRDFKDTDHINHNKLDNRRRNLRAATRSQNLYNKGRQRNNVSGFKGVNLHGKNWRAYIYVNGKQIFLGHFDTKEEAAKVYNKAARKYHKEFAYLNED